MTSLKGQLRRMLITNRRSISFEERATAAEQAADLFCKTTLFKNSKNIACYLARKDEFDCMPLIQKLWETHKHCYLPVLTEKNENSLIFKSYQKHDKLHFNKFHILEPENTKIIAADDLDLAILPLVGFDATGNRLGMGAGYYDKTFAYLCEKSGHHCKLIGLAYQLQQVFSLPRDPWDVPLNGVLTEEGLRVF